MAKMRSEIDRIQIDFTNGVSVILDESHVVGLSMTRDGEPYSQIEMIRIDLSLLAPGATFVGRWATDDPAELPGGRRSLPGDRRLLTNGEKQL